MRPRGNRGAARLAIAVLLCLTAALLPAATHAHQPTEVPVYEWVDEPILATREVPVYEWVDEDVYGWVDVPQFKIITVKVRIAPFSKTVPVYGPGTVTECVTIHQQHVCYEVPGTVQVGTKTVPVYNYRTETREVPDGVKPVWMKTGTRRVKQPTGETTTETYDTGRTRRAYVQTGTRTVHDPSEHPPPQPTSQPTSQPTPKPTCPANTFSEPLPQEAVFYADAAEVIRLRGEYFGTTYEPVVPTVYFVLTPTWEALSSNPNCYAVKLPDNDKLDLKAVIVDGTRYAVSTSGRVIIGGAEYLVKGGRLVLEVAADYVLSAVERAAKEAADAAIAALEAADRFLKRNLCSFEGQASVNMAIGVTVWVASRQTVGTVVTAVTAATGGTATVVGIGVAIAINAYCAYKATQGDDDDTEEQNQPDNPPKPQQPSGNPQNPPAATPAATPEPVTNADLSKASQDAAAGRITRDQLEAIKARYRCQLGIQSYC